MNGTDVSTMEDNELSEVRNREIGFIFQGFNLISNLTAIENVELPLVYRGVDRKTRHKLAVESLTMVGLEKRMDHRPNEMSGGQQQRVAIARAIAAQPPVIWQMNLQEIWILHPVRRFFRFLKVCTSREKRSY